MTNYIFDLDATLYQDNGEFEENSEKLIVKFFMDRLNVSEQEAQALRAEILEQYRWEAEAVELRFNIPEKEFMDYICDADISHLPKNPELNELLKKLSGRRFIFSDSTEKHVRDTLRHIGVDEDLFERIFVAEHNDFRFKFQAGAFSDFCKFCKIAPEEAIIFEDSLRNIKEAKKMGMATVLISPDKKDAPDVDYQFKNINDALTYFVK